ncbi:hypothetical protein BZG02_18895 [Labilibaculum filiforme]|uniref:Uncharacterized protein n=1 Tax=Labilibaculum filiforme TaxID=1940526 RepID=A0A2N3HR52_9BACT|nr:hypothetical protein [Labilibaculum filiforme]PKQ60533.1 hypothetical protein BZG02_18895 [Labilibaculum filiforme]
MPYRRLPNTDSARVRALKSALEISYQTNRFDLAFSFILLQKVETFLPHYELAIRNQRQALSQQSIRSKEYNEKLRKARLYVSHFIQVLNFTIIRGELKPEVREFYGLKISSKAAPSLLQDAKVIEWGEKLIKGEQERMRTGGNPIYSPSIALVRVNCENFSQAFNNQKTLQNNTQRFSEKVAEYRAEADSLILSLWNEIEAKFSDLSDEEKREKASEYGVVYVWRKGERERLAHLKQAAEDSLTLPFSQSVKTEQ